MLNLEMALLNFAEIIMKPSFVFPLALAIIIYVLLTVGLKCFIIVIGYHCTHIQ